MVAFMSYGSQLSGNSVLTYYLPSMYTQLGITSTSRRLLLTFANNIVSCAGAVAGSATNDKIGRRTKLWVGSVVLGLLFAAVTGFSSQFTDGDSAQGTSLALSNAGVAMVCLNALIQPAKSLTDTICRSSSLAVLTASYTLL